MIEQLNLFGDTTFIEGDIIHINALVCTPVNKCDAETMSGQIYTMYGHARIIKLVDNCNFIAKILSTTESDKKFIYVNAKDIARSGDHMLSCCYHCKEENNLSVECCKNFTPYLICKKSMNNFKLTSEVK